MANTLATLVVKLAADVGEYISGLGKAVSVTDKQLRDIRRSVESAGKAFGLMAGSAATGFTYMVKHAAETADKLYKLSQSTGIAVETLSEMRYAADLAGVPLEDFAKSMNKLSRNAVDFAADTGEARRGFMALGIEVKDATGRMKSADALLLEIADKFKNFEDGANKTALAINLFGKAGAAMIPLLNQGAAAIKAARDEAAQFGLTLDSATGKAAEEFNDDLRRLQFAWQGVALAILKDMLPALNEASRMAVEWVKDGSEFRKGLADIAQGVALLGDSFLSLIALARIAKAVLSDYFKTAPETKTWQYFFPGTIIRDQVLAVRDSFNNVDDKIQDIIKTTTTFRDLVKDIGKEAERGAGAFAAYHRTVALGIRGGASQAEAKRGEVKPRTEAPGLPDPSKQNAIAKARAALVEAQAKIEIEALKDLAKFKQELLDWGHANGLVSEREYHAERQRIQDAAYAKEREQLEAALKAAEKAQAAAKASRDEAAEINATKDVAEARAALAKAEREYGQQTVQNVLRSIDAWKKYRDELAEVTDQILELTGREGEAAKNRLDRQFRDQRARAVVNFGEESKEVTDLDKLKALRVAQVEFNESRSDLSKISDRLRLEEERVQNALKTGAISELEALQRTSTARQRAVSEQEAIINNLKRIAEASKNPELIKQADEAAAALERLRIESDLVTDKFQEIFTGAASNAFADFISGAKSAKEAFNDFGKSVMRMINQMVAEALAKRLYNAIFGGATGGGGGGFSLLNPSTWFGRGGGGTSATPLADAAAASGVLGPYAMGTEYVPRTGLALLHQGEAVIPASENADRKIWGGRPLTIQNTFLIQGTMDRRSQEQIAVISGSAVRRAIARSG